MKDLTKLANQISRSPYNCASFILLSLCLSFTARQSQAQVNLAEGSFRQIHSEFLATHTKKPSEASRLRAFELIRAYSSKSTSSGMFGLGWCSNIEAKLIKSGTNQLEIENCPLRSKLKFKRAKAPAVNRFISMVTEGVSANAIPQYDSEGGQDGTISQTADGWLWTRPDGSWHRFSHDGQILEDALSNGRHIKYNYNKRKKLTEIDLGNAGQIKLSYLNEGILVADTVYKFSGRFLASVEQKAQPSVQYNYDALDNLISISTADGSSSLISYDQFDRVVFHKTKENCLQRYQYFTLAPLRMQVEKTETCRNRESQKKTYNFEFALNQKTEKILHSVNISSPGGDQKIFFHAEWGYPILIEEQKHRVYFSYNQQGQLVQRRLASENKELVYDSQNRLTKMILPGAPGKEVDITYNDQSNRPYMIAIKNEGYIKLRWNFSKSEIVEISPMKNSEQLKVRLAQALETLARPTQPQPKELTQ